MNTTYHIIINSDCSNQLKAVCSCGMRTIGTCLLSPLILKEINQIKQHPVSGARPGFLTNKESYYFPLNARYQSLVSLSCETPDATTVNPPIEN